MRNGASGWARSVRAVVVDHSPLEIQETYMSKGMDRKKDTKKKPAKTLMEKRAAKKQKKEIKPFSIARSALVSAYRLTLKYSWGRCSESLGLVAQPGC